MSSTEQLLLQYQGHIVPRSFSPGFVTLSFIISLIGSAATLELINRRTSRNGVLNQFILVSSAVCMGGIAIWCMHFIGNRAIDLADRQTELQIAYSSGFTALSFFVPIVVLLAAFIAMGDNNVVAWWRVVSGGSLAGGAICGMHYLGDASIANYTCVYNAPNVIGAAIIAVGASIAALSLFFVFRAAWSNSWWKRGICAVVLAGAVSGMHWCASTGTNYRLIRLNQEVNQLSRNITVIVVICLSVAASLVMAGTAIYSVHVLRRYATKAQQVVLAAAVFDKQGRILVSPDGLIPSEKVTDTYIERTPSDSFSVSHPLFHWMFQASRNWSSISGVISAMTNHLSQLPKTGRDGTVKLVDANGELVENYDIVFRELFCVAAANLAEKMKDSLPNVGVLWDEILTTGSSGRQGKRRINIEEILQDKDDDFAEKGEAWSQKSQDYGRGSLMFIVRRLENARDVERLEAAGFRFAEVNQVSAIIGSSMQIKTRNFGKKLSHMATFAEQGNMLEPGVHLAFFGVKARVGTYGFDILVRKASRNLLPTMKMPIERLESWHMDFIRQLDRMSIPALSHKLELMKRSSPREMLFASQFADTLEGLRQWIDDAVFEEAILTAKVVKAPCRANAESASISSCILITLRLVIPIHANVNSPHCEFIPLNFFKIHQLVYKNSPFHTAFSRSVHREISPIVNAISVNNKTKTPLGIGRVSSRLTRESRLTDMSHPFRKLGKPSTSAYPVDADGDPIPTQFGHKHSETSSRNSGSTRKLWKGNSDPKAPARDMKFFRSGPFHHHQQQQQQQSTAFGGIMVSQEIKVDVREADAIADTRTGSMSPRHALSSSQNTTFPDPIALAGAEHRRDSPSGSGIELTSISGGQNVHTGSGVGGTFVESEKTSDLTTFVDELFTICVDGR